MCNFCVLRLCFLFTLTQPQKLHLLCIFLLMMYLTRLVRFNIHNLLKQNKKKKLSIFVRQYNEVPLDEIPEVSPSKIKAFLKRHNISFEDGYTGFLTACPKCHKGSKATATHVYINKTTGTFLCASCKRVGTWNQLETFLSAKRNQKDDAVAQGAEDINKLVSEVQQNTIALSSLRKEVLNGIQKAFGLPVISTPTTNNLDIRIDETQTNLYFPLENALSETVGYRILNRESERETTQPSKMYTGVLTFKSSRNKDAAVLVPYISDFLTLANAKISGNIVCLPNGLLQLPQYVLPALERFNKLILWFGNDFTAWDAARNFAKKLNEKRCLFIRPVDTQPLPHLLPANQNFKTIINSAQPIWHKSVITFASLRQDVLAELQNIDKVQGIKWKRFPTLTKILKGHRRGELTILTGSTGSGKTTFMSEYSLDLAMQGVNTLWGSFEIRNARLARTMLQQMAGVPLDENLHLFDEWADRFEQLPFYFMTFHGQQTIKVVMEAVEHTTYVHDIAHVIIDNVQFMMGMTEAERHRDRFWQQDAIVAAFRTFATRNNCHVTLVIHPRKERDEDDLTASSIFGGAKASQEADNVLIIQDKRLTSIRGKKYVQIVKNRYSGDLGIMPLDFDKAALSYAQKKKVVEKATSVTTRSELDVAV